MPASSLIALLMTCAVSAVANGPEPGLPPPPVLTHSPWDGDWVLSQTRNPGQIKEAAADGYRFHVDGSGAIRWEVPTLREVVEGHVDADR